MYAKFGCSSCHTIAGEEGIFGPELTNIGAFRAPDYLRQAIVDPAAALPKGVMRPWPRLQRVPAGSSGHARGKEVSGVRVNEDSFTIQIKDRNSQLYSFRKTDLQTLDKEIGKSMMPNYTGKASGSELDDLVAYLWSRGGSK